jgi:glycosyltransferase involved in cell wall biosynthesis
VICTYNRARLLRQTLEQLSRMRLPADLRWELIVIDNNSSDDTAIAPAEFVDRLPVRVVSEPRQGKTWALNRSLTEAAADLIVWTDDDVLVDEDWLGAFLMAARRFPDAAVFGGPIAPWFPEPPDPVLLEAFPVVRGGFCGVDYQLAEGVIQEPYRVHGANMACRRSRIGSASYNVTLGPSGTQWMGNDDTTFVEAARAEGGSVVWVPGMSVSHYVDPARLEIGYLRSFYRGVGLTWIRDDGPPAGRRMFGAPLWLWRKYLTHAAAYAAMRPFSRLRGWTHLREFARYGGAIKASREFASGSNSGAGN